MVDASNECQFFNMAIISAFADETLTVKSGEALMGTRSISEALNIVLRDSRSKLFGTPEWGRSENRKVAAIGRMVWSSAITARGVS